MAFLCDELEVMTLTRDGVSLQLQTVIICHQDWAFFKNLDRYQSTSSITVNAAVTPVSLMNEW